MEVASETGAPRATISGWSTQDREKEKRVESHRDRHTALEALERRREKLMVQLDVAEPENAPRLTLGRNSIAG